MAKLIHRDRLCAIRAALLITHTLIVREINVEQLSLLIQNHHQAMRVIMQSRYVYDLKGFNGNIG